MRIGTWNLDNKSLNDSHREVLFEERCDVWLLTEMNPRNVSREGKIGEFHCYLSKGVMAPDQHWAAILSLETAIPLPNPHPASAAVTIYGVTYCSSILPWKGVKTGSAP